MNKEKFKKLMTSKQEKRILEKIKFEENLVIPLKCKYSSDEYPNCPATISWNFIINDFKDFLLETIQKIQQEEREYWMNQTANQHDNEIRKYERERIVGMIEKKLNKKGWGEYTDIRNQTMEDIINEIKKL